MVEISVMETLRQIEIYGKKLNVGGSDIKRSSGKVNDIPVSGIDNINNV